MIFYKFESVAGFFVGEELGTLSDLPHRRIDRREEGVRVFDDCVDVGNYQAVYKGESLGVDLSTADDEALLKIGLFRYFEGLFQRAGHCNFFRSVEAARNDYVDTAGESAADGFEGLAAHDDRAADSRAPEEAQVFGNMPQELVVASYGIVV